MTADEEIPTIILEDLGFDDFFASGRGQLGLGDFSMARVTAEYRGSYKVKNTGGEYLAKITGRQMFNSSSRQDYPAVGDWVAISALGAGQAVIRGVLPRRTIIKRKDINKNKIQIIAANIDTAFVVESVDRDFNINRLERYFAIATDGGVKSAVVLNKTDLISKEDLDFKLAQLKNRFGGVSIIPASVKTPGGLDGLRASISGGKTYCFLGSSGVGKSSLINTLLGDNIIKTGEVSQSTGRGKHSTTNREMYFLGNGGIVIDNPGMREVGMADASAGIDSSFDEITALARKCKFNDCSHIHETGCEVLLAVKSGKLDESKYLNYIGLKKEAAHYGMTELEKRQKDRKFGNFVKKTKKGLREYGYKDY
ncbi:MAG: ribosome small subunit-dependent GTPase A [Candidatus Doudnabacteria bacterium]|nr:ribosome small subunit-dependent GTPase A [Candidatus Doudnabacteria bacterium]